MINKPPPVKGLDTRIPIAIPITGRGFIKHGCGLGSEGLRVFMGPSEIRIHVYGSSRLTEQTTHIIGIQLLTSDTTTRARAPKPVYIG